MADTYFWLGAPRSGLASAAASWQDATTGANPAATAPGAADIAVLQGGAGVDEQIVGGILGTATLHLPGNSVIEGKLTTSSLLIGSFVTPYGLPTNAPAADDTNAVDVGQGDVPP